MTLYYGINGIDAESFQLDIPTNVIDVVPQNRVAPNIIDYVMDPAKITRSSINFKITGDQKGFVYFSIADQHMPPPIFEDVRDNN